MNLPRIPQKLSIPQYNFQLITNSSIQKLEKHVEFPEGLSIENNIIKRF